MVSEIKRICWKKAEHIFGKPLPGLVKERLEWELRIIDKTQMEEMFCESLKTVSKYGKDGNRPFVRGCGGSSFVAWLLGITEVNPLPAHYICQCCGKIIFCEGKDCGPDMPNKCCPKCGREMQKDGFHLPPEFFFGVTGENMRRLDMFFDSPDFITFQLLQEKTGIKIKDIPFDDQKTLQNINEGKTLSIEEFADPKFQTLLRCFDEPSFAKLIRISGLRHGSGVWENNGENLMRKGYPLSEIICFREDIMLYLLARNLERNEAFYIAEKVRRGRGLEQQDENLMKNAGVPQQYISSCKKIEYLFPKAHVALQVMNAYRLAYYSVHFKDEFLSITERGF